VRSFVERNPARIGLVVIVTALASVGAVLTVNRSIFTSSYTVAARFSNAAGIGPGAKVTLAGVDVGTVSGVHLDGNAVLVDLAVNQGVVLPRRTAASIEVETVLGVLDVALQPLGGWSSPLRDGALITDTSVPVELQQVENTAGNLLQQADVAAFNKLLTAIDDIARGKQAQVAQIVQGLDRFTGVVDARSTQVSDLIDAANRLASTVAARDSQLSSVVSSVDQVVQGLAARSSDLASLIQQTDRMASQTAALVGGDQPQVQQLLDHLHAVLGVVAQHQLDLAEGVAYLDSGLQGFSSIGFSGSAPNSWGNIYFDLLGSTGIDSVLGSCGILDQALNQVLGPDPLPCSQRSGPAVTSTGTPVQANVGSPPSTGAPHLAAGPASGGGPAVSRGALGPPSTTAGPSARSKASNGALGQLIGRLFGA
jgi:phospholipid/cholesterol/gamma-HCH transport system substrate-binding protein